MSFSIQNVFFIILITSLTPFLMLGNCFTIGHRGCAYEPENSLAAFNKAIAIGVDAVEFDVQRCKTGELVVIHPVMVNKLFNQERIEDKTFQELAHLDLGNGESIPTLEQVLDCINRRCMAVIELKAAGTAEPTAAVIEKYVNKYGWQYSDFILLSEFYNELKQITWLREKGVRFAPLYIPDRHDFEQMIALADIVVMPYRLLSLELAEIIHQRECNLFVGVVDKVCERQFLQWFPVDGIFSNYP